MVLLLRWMSMVLYRWVSELQSHKALVGVTKLVWLLRWSTDSVDHNSLGSKACILRPCVACIICCGTSRHLDSLLWKLVLPKAWCFARLWVAYTWTSCWGSDAKTASRSQPRGYLVEVQYIYSPYAFLRQTSIEKRFFCYLFRSGSL